MLESAMEPTNATVYAASALSAATVPTNGQDTAIWVRNMTVSRRVRMAVGQPLATICEPVARGAREGLGAKCWTPDLSPPYPAPLHAPAHNPRPFKTACQDEVVVTEGLTGTARVERGRVFQEGRPDSRARAWTE